MDTFTTTYLISVLWGVLAPCLCWHMGIERGRTEARRSMLRHPSMRRRPLLSEPVDRTGSQAS